MFETEKGKTLCLTCIACWVTTWSTLGTSLSNHFQSSSQVTVQTHVGSDTESSVDLNSGNIDSSDYMATPENPNRFEPNFNMPTPEMLLLRRRTFKRKFDAKEVDDSVHMPAPEMLQKKCNTKEVALPRQLFLGETSHLCDFVQNINKVMNCKTTHCQGKLIPTSFKLKGLGGTIVVTYNCSECGLHPIHFTTNKPIKDSTRSEVATALQVAFIISGGTHATYRLVTYHGLGMEVFGNPVFASVIESLYFVVKQMVDITHHNVNQFRVLPTITLRWTWFRFWR